MGKEHLQCQRGKWIGNLYEQASVSMTPATAAQYATPFYNNYNMQLMTMGMHNMGIGNRTEIFFSLSHQLSRIFCLERYFNS